MPPRVALVTGSGKKRVGSVVADALARRGHAIAIHYHRSVVDAEETVAALRGHGVETMTCCADLANELETRAMVRAVLDRFGRIDVVVNCAAVWESKRLEDVSAADLRRHFDVNALGTFVCSQEAGLTMVRQPEGGLIVTVGDWADVRPYLHYSAYFASKGAVASITRCLAVELGTRNPKVRVNCILPGPVMLPPDLSDEERRESIAGTLAKREGSPHHVAQAVLSFLDNDYITGVSLPVDGGRTVYACE